MSSSPTYFSSVPPHRASQRRWSASNTTEGPSPRFASQKVRLGIGSTDITALEERQRSLRAQLSAIQEQQLRENFVNFSRVVSSRIHPDSLELIIYGQQEQLERVAQEIAALQRQTLTTCHEEAVCE